MKPTRHLKPTSIGLPVPLLDQINAEAVAHGMSRNAYIVLVLSVHLRAGSIAALEKRVATLEGQ